MSVKGTGVKDTARGSCAVVSSFVAAKTSTAHMAVLPNLLTTARQRRRLQ